MKNTTIFSLVQKLGLTLLATALLAGTAVRAQSSLDPATESPSEASTPTETGGSSKPQPPGFQREVPEMERWQNFGLVYAAQLGFYLTSQEDAIRDHGSFENWRTYPFSPHFDKDHLDFNLTKHTLSGSAYYLYYRSQGYTYQSAFLWSVVSSLAFEFTIETYTEKPSFQDMYQTPVFGSVIGFGLEHISDRFHRLDTWYGHGLGFLFNPFSIIWPKNSYSVFQVSPDSYSVFAKWEF